MKIQFRYLYLLMFSFVFFSCGNSGKYQNSSIFQLEDFKGEISLHGRSLEFDEIIMNPGSLQVYDSVLVTLEYGGDTHCHLFNLNTRKKIGERLKRGQGPNEMLMAQFVEGNKSYIQFLDVVSSVIYCYDIHDFINNENPRPVHKVKLPESIHFEMQELGGKYVAHPYFKPNQLFIFNEQGEKIKEFAGFPDANQGYSDIENADAFYMGFVSDMKDRIAICYYMTDLIDIYTMDGKLQHRIHGPEQFLSHVRQINKESGPTTMQVKEKSRDAYFAPQNAGDRFLVLYNGGYVTEEDHSSSCKKLMSFSWNAEPLNLYLLDDPIFSFCVDESKRKIYGVSVTPEYHIVEYSY